MTKGKLTNLEDCCRYSDEVRAILKRIRRNTVKKKRK